MDLAHGKYQRDIQNIYLTIDSVPVATNLKM